MWVKVGERSPDALDRGHVRVPGLTQSDDLLTWTTSQVFQPLTHLYRWLTGHRQLYHIPIHCNTPQSHTHLYITSDKGLSLSLSLRFNGNFPGEPGLACVYISKGWWRWWWQLVVTCNWSCKSCNDPVKSSTPTNQHPSCRPTNSVKALKGKISHSMDLLTPTSPGVFQLCLWALIASGYLGRGLPCLSSALWCQHPTTRAWE